MACGAGVRLRSCWLYLRHPLCPSRGECSVFVWRSSRPKCCSVSLYILSLFVRLTRALLRRYPLLTDPVPHTECASGWKARRLVLEMTLGNDHDNMHRYLDHHSTAPLPCQSDLEIHRTAICLMPYRRATEFAKIDTLDGWRPFQVLPENMICVDIKGVVYKGREDLDEEKYDPSQSFHASYDGEKLPFDYVVCPE